MVKARVQISLQRFLLKVICVAIVLAVIGVNVNVPPRLDANVALPIRVFSFPFVTASFAGLVGVSNDNFWLTWAAGFVCGLAFAIPIYVGFLIV
jgi:hypothetical protein